MTIERNTQLTDKQSGNLGTLCSAILDMDDNVPCNLINAMRKCYLFMKVLFFRTIEPMIVFS